MSGTIEASGCDGFDYAPFYCEENIYRLAARLSGPPDSRTAGEADDQTVLFITNADRTVALLSQAAGRKPDGLVIWDYHVVLRNGTTVYDLDTVLPCPLSPADWLARTAPLALYERFPHLAPHFIEVPVNAFLTQFSTDRRHMRTATGAFIHPPPAWPAPFQAEHGHNLPQFLGATHSSVRRVVTVSQAHHEW